MVLLAPSLSPVAMWALGPASAWAGLWGLSSSWPVPWTRPWQQDGAAAVGATSPSRAQPGAAAAGGRRPWLAALALRAWPRGPWALGTVRRWRLPAPAPWPRAAGRLARPDAGVLARRLHPRPLPPGPCRPLLRPLLCCLDGLLHHQPGCRCGVTAGHGLLCALGLADSPTPTGGTCLRLGLLPGLGQLPHLPAVRHDRPHCAPVPLSLHYHLGSTSCLTTSQSWTSTAARWPMAHSQDYFLHLEDPSATLAPLPLHFMALGTTFDPGITYPSATGTLCPWDLPPHIWRYLSSPGTISHCALEICSTKLPVA